MAKVERSHFPIYREVIEMKGAKPIFYSVIDHRGESLPRTRTRVTIIPYRLPVSKTLSDVRENDKMLKFASICDPELNPLDCGDITPPEELDSKPGEKGRLLYVCLTEQSRKNANFRKRDPSSITAYTEITQIRKRTVTKSRKVKRKLATENYDYYPNILLKLE